MKQVYFRDRNTKGNVAVGLVLSLLLFLAASFAPGAPAYAQTPITNGTGSPLNISGTNVAYWNSVSNQVTIEFTPSSSLNFSNAFLDYVFTLNNTVMGTIHVGQVYAGVYNGVYKMVYMVYGMPTGYHVTGLQSVYAGVYQTHGILFTVYLAVATPPPPPPAPIGGGGAPAASPTTITTATASIGPAGGTVATSDNSAVVVVPPGAFSTTVTMSLTAVCVPTAPAPPAGFVAAVAWCINTGGVQPTKPALATFKYDPTILNGRSPSRLGVYLYNTSTGKWSWVAGMVNTSNDTITAPLSEFSTYAVLANTQVFTDLGQVPWARSAVDTLLGADLVAGMAPGIFDPDGTLTRAQFTTFLVKADGLAPVSSGTTPFTDVPATAWYAPYVAAAYQAGLVAGVSSTSFEPNASITREQMAVLLGKLLGSSAPAGSLSQFSDAFSIAPWAQSGVKAAVGAGLMTGFPNGTFQPTGTATRAQAAVVVAGYLKYLGKV